MSRTALEHESPTDFAERVRRLRARFGLSQAKLAALLGVSFASVNRWERGHVRPSELAWRLITSAESDCSLSIRQSSFVGRERELRVLQAKLDDATLARGSIVLLSGEPGVGKTRLAQEFATIARARGAVALYGRCYEGEWTQPQSPWLQALGQYAATAGPERLRESLESSGTVLTQLIPAARVVLPDVPEVMPLAAEDERFRVYDAVAQALLIAARRQPVVVVLDDLHWANRACFELLLYLAPSVAQSRLLLIGIYRDVGLGPDQPLVQCLIELNRQRFGESIRVSNLTREATAALVVQLLDTPIAESVSSTIYHETEGSPFFIEEIVWHLREGGQNLSEGDARPETWDLPQGVRQAVSKRIAALSPEAQRTLESVALFGGCFDFRSMQSLTAMPEAVLLDTLDELLAAKFLRATGKKEMYEFGHVLLRRVLYDALNPSRRARLHLRTAHALERAYAGREHAVAAELADQYHRAATLPGAVAGIPHAVAAAEQARIAADHPKAVVCLQMARDLAAWSDAAVRADILCRLAVAEAEALSLDEAQRTAETALAALVACGADADAIANFLASVAGLLKEGGVTATVWQPLVERGLALLGERRNVSWARLTLLLDRFEPIAAHSINALRWLGRDPEAVAVARSHGSEDDYVATVELLDWHTLSELGALVTLTGRWQRPTAVIKALSVVVHDLVVCHGAFCEAIEALRKLRAASERYGSTLGKGWGLVQHAAISAELGDFGEVQQARVALVDLLQRLGPDHRLQATPSAIDSTLAFYLSDDAEWALMAEPWCRLAAEPGPSNSGAAHIIGALAALACVRAKDQTRSRTLLADLGSVLERLGPTAFGVSWALGTATVAAFELEAVEFAAAYRTLAFNAIAADVGDCPTSSNALTIACTSALLGDMAGASEYFGRARASVEATRRRPLRGIIDYDQALALTRAGSVEPERIMGLLDAALAEFRALGMEPWAKKALDLQERLREDEQCDGRPRGIDPNGLTQREVEVLRLLAQGQSNQEIADALVISINTVARHLVNIYTKIGARNRAEAVAYALRHDLI